MIKRFVIAIVLLVLVCGGIVGFNIFRAHAIKQFFATMKQPAVTVSTVKVEPVTWQPGISAIGTVGARRGVDVAVETSGTVTEVNFKANQNVKKGDVLVQLDDEVERADLASAKSALNLAQDNLNRIRQLANRGVSATSALESAQAQATQAESSVQKLKAVLDQKQLKAPFSGTIGIPKIELGQYVTAGTAAATLQQLDTMRVDFTVPEQEFSNLKLGQAIKVGQTEGALKFTGSIIGINPKIDPSSRLVSVRGEIANPGLELRPGQFVRVEVELPTEKGIVALPQTAVTTSLYGDYVFAVRDAGETKADAAGTASEGAPKSPTQTAAAGDAQKPASDQTVAKQVFVTLGRHSGGMVEVEKGVKPGDVIVTAGQNRLSSGVPVKVDNSVEPKPVTEDEARL
ncbi:MAG: efflux RND transporter periplasmic adaptor subunit [Pararhizobium sp.]